MATLLTRHRKATWFGWLGGALLAILVGQALLWSPMHLGDELARLSYDLPFPWARHRVPPELTMVYLDTRIKTNLGQPTDQPLARRFYTQLLERLTRQGARLVL